jgi:hypothetical protein
MKSSSVRTMPYPGLPLHRFAVPLFRIAPPEDHFRASVEVFGIYRNRFPGGAPPLTKPLTKRPSKEKRVNPFLSQPPVSLMVPKPGFECKKIILNQNVDVPGFPFNFNRSQQVF